MRRAALALLRIAMWSLFGLVAGVAFALFVHWYVPVSDMKGTRTKPSWEVIDRARPPDPSGAPLKPDAAVFAHDWPLFARSYIQVNGTIYQAPRRPPPEGGGDSVKTYPVGYCASLFRTGYPFYCLECVVRDMREIPADRYSGTQLFSWTEYEGCFEWAPPKPMWLVAPGRGYAAATPTRILLPGLLANTPAWAVFVYAAVRGPRHARRFLRRRRGDCIACGYELAGLATCPECGSVR